MHHRTTALLFSALEQLRATVCAVLAEAAFWWRSIRIIVVGMCKGCKVQRGLYLCILRLAAAGETRALIDRYLLYDEINCWICSFESQFRQFNRSTIYPVQISFDIFLRESLKNSEIGFSRNNWTDPILLMFCDIFVSMFEKKIHRE